MSVLITLNLFLTEERRREASSQGSALHTHSMLYQVCIKNLEAPEVRIGSSKSGKATQPK